MTEDPLWKFLGHSARSIPEDDPLRPALVRLSRCALALWAAKEGRPSLEPRVYAQLSLAAASMDRLCESLAVDVEDAPLALA